MARMRGKDSVNEIAYIPRQFVLFCLGRLGRDGDGFFNLGIDF